MSCCICYVQSCCCNCASLKTGVIIWAIIDMLYNMAAFVGVSRLTRFETGMEIPNLFYWKLVVIFADFCIYLKSMYDYILVGHYNDKYCWFMPYILTSCCWGKHIEIYILAL